MKCIQCGKCCWNWKENKLWDKCSHLGSDLKTCTVYDRLEEVGRPECALPLQPQQSVDLPNECPYKVKP